MKSHSVRITVSKDKNYYWCSCGLSEPKPFCDGSHKDDEKGRKLIHYMSTQDRFINFCTRKKTNHPLICDGSHNKK